MDYLEVDFASPAFNLAFDEALLDMAEQGIRGGTLRFWESSSLFVVVGYGNKVGLETCRDECRKDEIPILRRCSGGGTVLQGPGCLNYSVVLPNHEFPECESITSTNQFVMGRIRDAIERVAGPGIRIQGHTDLCRGTIKFSGNAQRRKKNAVLFHGTVLHQFDISKVPKYLLPPSKEPSYREGRNHLDFIANLPVSSRMIMDSIRMVWEANELVQIRAEDFDFTESLVAEKYGNKSWNEKF
jgi:lipoate-protein ligase A